MAHGRKRRVTGGRGVAGTAHASMGAQLPVSTAVTVCQPTDRHGPGANFTVCTSARLWQFPDFERQDSGQTQS